MSLSAGTRIGTYEVVSLLGAGGMGEVYRALDTRLKREVALKVLPEIFASDSERLARFAREAEVLAALNHPNIAAIYGLEEATGVRALVIELVEGDTLADRIARGPVPLDEALPLARQIADALDAAHDQGIIHRDLKPANVKLRDDGTVKVLDFGLAKLADTATGGGGASGLSLSPTITSPALMTGIGTLLGTAAYMSPEQAKGRPADRRSDVWAFGCVLFELLAGKRAFEGDDVTETIAAVVRGEPDWAALPAGTPRSVETLLRRCLEKDRRARVSGMAAAQFALNEQRSLIAPAPAMDRTAIDEEVRTAVDEARRQLGRQKHRWIAGVAVLGLLATVGAAAAAWIARRPAPPQVSKLALAPIPAAPAGIAANSHDVAITADGTRVVYFTDPAGGTERPTLAVRALDQLDATALRVTRSFAPFISPDGAWVGFNDQGERAIKKISILGGAAVPIATDVPALRGASWGPDDTIVYGLASTGSGLWRVPAGGGKPVEITTADKTKNELHAYPEFLPGGKAVLFTILTSSIESSQIAVLDLQTRQHRVIIPRGSYPRYSPTGHIVYASGSTLFAVAFDLDRLSVIAEPKPVLQGVVMKDSGASNFDISDNGTLVYVPGDSADASRRIVFLSATGTLTPAPGLEVGNYRSVSVGPTGSQIAFETGPGGGEGNLWTYDVNRGVRNVLTTGDPDDRNPVWHPTENRIVFGSNRDGRWGAFAVNADGSGLVERLKSLIDDKTLELWPWSMSREGTTVFLASNSGSNAEILIAPVDGGPADNRLRTEFIESHPSLSPDGSLLAYMSQRSGRGQVYLERYPALRDRVSVSSSDGAFPVWSRNGRELYYYSPVAQELIAVPVTPGRELRIGTPRPIYKGRLFTQRGWRPFDVMPDGRFVLIVPNQNNDRRPVAPIVQQNWTEELKRLVPVR
jgi:serine/threonine-protein kinase